MPHSYGASLTPNRAYSYNPSIRMQVYRYSRFAASSRYETCRRDHLSHKAASLPMCWGNSIPSSTTLQIYLQLHSKTSIFGEIDPFSFNRNTSEFRHGLAKSVSNNRDADGHNAYETNTTRYLFSASCEYSPFSIRFTTVFMLIVALNASSFLSTELS